MQRSTVLSVAAVCGLVAFGWALLNAPAPGRGGMGGGGGRPAMGAARVQPPRDLEGLTEWVRENPGDADAWFALANLRRDQGDEPGARAAWGRVFTLASEQIEGPRRMRMAFMKAWAADRLGEAEVARAAFAEAGALYEAEIENPRFQNSWRFWHRLGWCRSRTGDEEGAARAWARAVEALESQGAESPRSPLAIDLARNLALAGRRDEALALLAQLENGPDRAELEHDESLAGLREDARFRAVLRRAGRRWITSGG